MFKVSFLGTHTVVYLVSERTIAPPLPKFVFQSFNESNIPRVKEESITVINIFCKRILEYKKGIFLV